MRQSQWPRGLRRGSMAVRLLQLRVWILLGAWMSVSCEFCVLSGTGLCDGPIPHPEESYQLWCVSVCDLETLSMRRLKPTVGCNACNRRRRWRSWYISKYLMWSCSKANRVPVWHVVMSNKITVIVFNVNGFKLGLYSLMMAMLCRNMLQ
jgi:hypothetical protein